MFGEKGKHAPSSDHRDKIPKSNQIAKGNYTMLNAGTV